jgi:hypothetical protein
MLSTELQPAVRQIVQRNGELEEENKQLYDKVHQLLTEVTALRAIRGQYESLVAGHGSQLLSPPSQTLRDTVQRQKRQIARLQDRLDSAETDAQVPATQKAESSNASNKMQTHSKKQHRAKRTQVKCAPQ